MSSVKTKSTEGRRLVGLDIGGRRVGVAVSDELGLIATPVTAVDLKRGGLEALRKEIEKYDPARIIVGLPTTMAGREGAQAEEVRAVAKELATLVNIPIRFWDERLTTTIAERSLVESGRRGKARKDHVDAVAAALILQNYLDSRRR